ncbi:phosphohydrolase [Sulfolobales archaeon HS-7]|nr:phosphohydrolase [Sulfolobales archaeon HS-7]
MNIERITAGTKNLIRTGWMQRGVPPALGETVAEHSFEAAILTLNICISLKDINVNCDRASTLALLHDVGEVLLGDIPKWASERIQEKDNVEFEALLGLGVPKEYAKELKERSTYEAKLAKLGDIISSIIQAIRYEKIAPDTSEIKETYMKQLKDYLDRDYSFARDSVLELLKTYNLNL